MRKHQQSDPEPSDAQPYILGRPDLNERTEEQVARLERPHPSSFRTHQPDLLIEKSRLDETVRNTGSITPETEWTEQEPSQNLRRPVTFVALSLAILLAATFFAVRTFVDDPNPDVLPPRPARTFAESASAAELRHATEQAVRGFMNSSNDLDRSQFVFGGTEVAEKMRQFHQRPDSPSPQGFGKILDLQPGVFNGIPLHAVVVAESNGLIGWHFNLFPSTDRMLIDWESSVAYGEKSWPDLLIDRSPKPVAMRVYLKRSYRFAEPYDEPSFDAFEVSARGFEDKIFAYAPRDSDLARQLATAVPEGASRPVHIRLQWPSTDPDKLSLEIVDFIHDFWVDAERLHRSTQGDSTN